MHLRSILAVLLCAGALPAQIELTRYDVSSVALPSGSGQTLGDGPLSDDGIYIELSTWICRPGAAPVDLRTLVPSTWTNVEAIDISGSGVIVGRYSDASSGGLNVFTLDANTGVVTSRIVDLSRIANIADDWRIAPDGFVAGSGSSVAGPQRPMIAFGAPPAPLSVLLSALIDPSPIFSSATVYDVASGGWAVHGHVDLGLGGFRTEGRLVLPDGSIRRLPTGTPLAVSAQGQVVIQQDLLQRNFVLWQNGEAVNLPSFLEGGQTVDWQHVDDRGWLHAISRGISPGQRVVRIDGQNVWLRSLVDNVAHPNLPASLGVVNRFSDGGSFSVGRGANLTQLEVVTPGRRCVAMEIRPFLQHGDETQARIRRDRSMQVTVFGGEPGRLSAVFITNHGPPILLGSGNLDSQGEFTISLTVPPSLTVGTELLLVAFALDSRQTVLDSPVRRVLVDR